MQVNQQLKSFNWVLAKEINKKSLLSVNKPFFSEH